MSLLGCRMHNNTSLATQTDIKQHSNTNQTHVKQTSTIVGIQRSSSSETMVNCLSVVNAILDQTQPTFPTHIALLMDSYK